MSTLASTRVPAQTRSVLLDLGEEAAREKSLDLPAQWNLTAFERATAIAFWRTRMVQEHVSARVFASLIAQMMKAGIRAEYQSAVGDMVTQEFRHARLCATVIHALGGEAVAPVTALPDVPTHDDVSPLEAVLRNVLSISCISETTAVAEFAFERECLWPGPIRDMQKEILADEVNHARFGWRLVDELSPQLCSSVRKSLSEYLVYALRQRFERALEQRASRAATPRLAAIGGADGEQNFELFLQTIHEVVLPGLEGCGLHARQAWASVVQ